MDKNFAICIGRQFGSGGRTVSQKLAEILGVNIYDRTLLESAVRETGLSADVFVKADEARRGGKGIRSLFMNHLSGSHSGSLPGNNFLSDESVFGMQSDIIRRIHEQESCIFVGRCADYVLRDSDRILSVFLSADRNFRIQRLKAHDDTSDRRAESMIDEADRKRSSYFNYYTGRNWSDPASYDLCLNTSALGLERCAGIIADIARAKLEIK